MRRLDAARFSDCYAVRHLNAEDAGAVLELYQSNPLFFRAGHQAPTMDHVRRDMALLPPEVEPERKYFVGLCDGDTLTAVLDLIDGYPTPDTAYLGLFMVHGAASGQGRGSGIVTRLCQALGAAGFSALRLAYDKDNPQSSHFWQKNGFAALYETDSPEYGHLIVAERRL